ncbi:hypothetical protein Tco_1230571 [Tanacetum coccineum]
MSTYIADAAALSPYSFGKRYRYSYETPSPSLSPTLPIRKRYLGTSELVYDTKEESSDSNDKREGLEDEGPGSDDEGHGLEDEGHGSKEEEEEVAPEGQQQAVSGSVPSTFEVGQSSRSVPDHEGVERIFAFRQPTLVTWVDPEDGRVYTGILTYVPPAVPVQTPPSPEGSPSYLPRENHDLRRQITEERRERLELIDRVARMERRQESGGA